MSSAEVDNVHAVNMNTDDASNTVQNAGKGVESGGNTTNTEQTNSNSKTVSDVKTSSPAPASIDTRADAEDGYKGRMKLTGRENTTNRKQREDTGGGGGDDDGRKVNDLVTDGKKVDDTDTSDLDAEVEAIASELQDALSQTWQAPDGGWGWVIVISAMVVSLIVDGLTYTFGLFLGQFEKVFEAPKSTIALASSLQVGIYLVIGPVVSILTNRFGCRPIIVAGSFVAGLAYIVSSWSVDVTMLILTYGVFGGIGFGMMYLPAIVAVSVYFEEKRAVATGIAVCGSGIGTFILAPMTDLLLDEYNWSWTLLILGAIVLNGMVFGALVRPLDLEPAKRIDIEELGRGNAEDLEDAVSRKSGTSKRSGRDQEDGSVFRHGRRRQKTSESSWGQESVPMITLTDEEQKTTVMLSETPETLKPDSPSPNLFFSSTPNMIINSPSQLSKAVAKKGKKSSSKASMNNSMNALPRLRANTMDFVHRLHRRSSTSEKSSSSAGSRVQSHAPMGLAFISISDAHLNKIRDDIHLPLSRRDLSSSLAHHEWEHSVHRTDRSRGLYIQSIKSITSLSAQDGVDGVTKKPTGLWACLPNSARETLEEMLDFSILKDKSYWFVLLGNFFCMLGFYVPFVYLADHAKEIGIEEEKAAFLLSIIGITNTVGRVMTGVVMNFFDIDCVLVTSVALFLAGVVTIICPHCDTYATLAAASAIFGVCVAAYISLCSVLLCELLGVENLTNAFGFVILFRGVACIMGPPIAGAIIDSTGLFAPAFYVGGGMIVVSAVSHGLLLSPCCKRKKLTAR